MRKRVLSDEAAKVLKLFVDEPDVERFGRDIIVRTEVASGSLYPILHRHEKRGLLVSRWEDLDTAVKAGRRPRRLYRLDARNAGTAAHLVTEWQSRLRKSTSTRREVLGT